VTDVVAPFPRARRAIPRRARRDWGQVIQVAAFIGEVFMLLTYSQGWVQPLLGGDDAAADSALVRTLYLPAYAIGIFLVALTPWSVVRGLARQPFLLLLLAIVALSLIWSVTPDQTLRRLFALYFTTLGGVVIAARHSWARLAEVIAGCFAVLALMSLFVGLFVPSVGRMTDIFPGAWRGLWDEKNGFGGNMALGAVLCAAAALLNRRRAGLWWGAAALCVFLVLMSTSKTSLLSVGLGVGAIALIWTVRRGPAAGVAATWTAVVAIALVAGVAFLASDVIFGLLGKDATLTGRTMIWKAVLRQINERPWQGFGYAAVWDNESPWSPLAWIVHDSGFRPHHAHNSWLEQWLGLGLAGLIAWTAFFLQTLVANIVALYREKGAYLAMPYFVVYAVMTFSESIAVQYNDMRWAIFVALAVKLALPDGDLAPAMAPARPLSRRGAGRSLARSPSNP
jgi:exopolysaccharide production protein ExoQ